MAEVSRALLNHNTGVAHCKFFYSCSLPTSDHKYNYHIPSTIQKYLCSSITMATFARLFLPDLLPSKHSFLAVSTLRWRQLAFPAFTLQSTQEPSVSCQAPFYRPSAFVQLHLTEHAPPATPSSDAGSVKSWLAPGNCWQWFSTKANNMTFLCNALDMSVF